MIGFIILLSLVLYFQQLTKDASSISDRELKAKILHIPGDELINHNNQILEEYDHSQNTLIVGPNHVNSNIIHALTASEDTLFYKHNGIMPKALLR
ncbi:transglycosylase, partial [Paenibacillus macerans]